MKYKFLRKYCGLRDGEYSKSHGGSSNVFSNGIGYYYSGRDGLLVVCLTSGVYGNNCLIDITVRDSISKWRKKLDKHTSSAEWDIIRRGK